MFHVDALICILSEITDKDHILLWQMHKIRMPIILSPHCVELGQATSHYLSLCLYKCMSPTKSVGGFVLFQRMYAACKQVSICDVITFM